MFASILISLFTTSLALQSPIRQADVDQSKVCLLRSTAISVPEIHPDLMAVASQYFHPEHRGGYDALRSADDATFRPFEATSFPWFDVRDLTRPVIPPVGARVVIPLRGEYFVNRRLPAKPCCHEELGLWRRGDRAPRWLGMSLYPDSAIQTRTGEVWAIARGDAKSDARNPPVRLLHIGTDGKIDDRRLEVSPWGLAAELALTSEDKPVLIFLRRIGGHLRLRLSWSLDPSDSIVLDEVTVPVSVASLAEQTGVSITIAPDGDRGVGVAWRPLTEKTSENSEGPIAAEVRWLSIETEGGIIGPHRFATVAQPVFAIGGGNGPWPLTGNGLQGGELAGHAFFAWNEEHNVVGARSVDEVPSPLAPSSFSGYGIQIRPQKKGLELLLFQSSPSVKSYRVDCDDP